MTTFGIGKTFTFDAAHHIPHHEGKCRRPHGHTYKVEFFAEADDLQDDGPQAGMVIDFGDLSAVWKRELEPLLDHQDLNETLEGHVRWTTAEEIAAFCLRTMAERVSEVVGCRVWETPDSYAFVSF